MSSASDPENPYAPPRTIETPPVIGQSGHYAGPQYAPCPRCGCTFADKVGFTWWGGVLGPALFTHVKCKQCKVAFNGKSGKSNDTAIAIYFGVTLALGIGVFVLMAVLGG